MRRRTLSLATLLAACLLALSGCGDDSDEESAGDAGGSANNASGYSGGGAGDDSGGASTLRLAADPGGALKFDKTSLSAKAGKVTVVMDNPSDVPHAVEVEGKGVEEEGKTVGKGGVSKVTVDLDPGKYEYYCPVGNHQGAGMEGTLTVR